MKTTKIVDKGSIQFKIEHDDGETLESLSADLAEAFLAKDYYTNQEAAFRVQSQNERRKASERVTILGQLKDYNRQKKNWSSDHKVSRMERMETYDAEMLEEEKKEFLRRANEFHEQADEFADLIKEQQRKINITQAKINKARNGAKR